VARWRLLCDLAVGQRLLQVGDACGGDLGAPEVERLQPGHPLEVYEPRVGDRQTTTEGERLQPGQPLEMYQPRVGDLGGREFEVLQIGQPLEVQQPRTWGVFPQEYACFRGRRCEIRCS